MSDIADIRRLEKIVGRLTGDKALRDEAIAIIRGMIDAQESTSASAEWWANNGCEPDRHWRPGISQLSPKPRSLVDLIVVFGPDKVNDVARQLGIEPQNARRLVARTDTELLDRGAKAMISITHGIVHTSTRIIVSLAARADD
jgi:hypothetical protein